MKSTTDDIYETNKAVRERKLADSEIARFFQPQNLRRSVLYFCFGDRAQERICG